jgi:hypothetical protein
MLLAAACAFAEKLEPFADAEVLKSIREIKSGSTDERPVKQVELEAPGSNAAASPTSFSTRTNLRWRRPWAARHSMVCP